MVACIPKLLEEIIAEDLHELPANKNFFRLIEHKTKEKLSVGIDFTDYSAFCFSIDKDRIKTEDNSESVAKDLLFPFFNPQAKGVLSKNDFIIVTQKQNTIFILLIELKSTNPEGYLKQLHSAKLFMQFVFEKVCLCHPNFKVFKDEFKIEYKGILFHQPKNPDKLEEPKKSKNKKLLFEDKKGLLVTQQNYDSVYYLSQFI